MLKYLRITVYFHWLITAVILEMQIFILVSNLHQRRDNDFYKPVSGDLKYLKHNLYTVLR